MIDKAEASLLFAALLGAIVGIVIAVLIFLFRSWL